MSDTPLDADALRQYLTDTEPGPSELRDLLVCLHADPGAIKVLCKHAERSPSLHGAVFAARDQLAKIVAQEYRAGIWHDLTTEPQTAAALAGHQIDSWLRTQCQNVADTEVQAVLRTVRTELADEDPYLPVRLSYWFSDSIPHEAMTDKMVAEMSLTTGEFVGQDLVVGPNEYHDLYPHLECLRLVSCYVHNRFGDHGPSWDAFKMLYDSPEAVGATADTVAKLHTQLGTCDRTWATFMNLYNTLKTDGDVDDIAALAAKLESPTS